MGKDILVFIGWFAEMCSINWKEGLISISLKALRCCLSCLVFLLLRKMVGLALSLQDQVPTLACSFSAVMYT